MGKSLEPLSQNDSLSSDSTTSGKLRLFKGVEYHLALLFIFVGEEESDMSFHELTQAIRMWLEGVILISPKGDPEHSILAHHKLAISEFFLKPLEVVGRHVVPRKHIQVLVLAHECMHTFYNELLVFSLLWFHLGQ